jgi:hypothetical protein
MDAPNEIRQYWQKEATKGLPAMGLVRERNQAITTRYATLYLKSQPLFKWAGLAVFASHKVGEAFLGYEFSLVNGEEGSWKDPTSGLLLPISLTKELELLRKANNQIYEDIAWALLAYNSPRGGLSLVNAGLEDVPSHQRMRDGFQKIEEGRRLLESGPERRREATYLIWQGNNLLLEHEQTVIVQPAFDAMGPVFDFVLSETTTLAFEANMFDIFTRYRAYFALFMCTRGLPILLRARSLPQIERLDQRWFWITKSPLKLWQTLDCNVELARNAVLEKAPGAAEPSHASFATNA